MAVVDRAVTIIIPTLGLRERAGSLRVAIESALAQEGVCSTVLVVLNGARRDSDVERALREDRRIFLLVREAVVFPPHSPPDGRW